MMRIRIRNTGFPDLHKFAARGNNFVSVSKFYILVRSISIYYRYRYRVNFRAWKKHAIKLCPRSYFIIETNARNYSSWEPRVHQLYCTYQDAVIKTYSSVLATQKQKTCVSGSPAERSALPQHKYKFCRRDAAYSSKSDETILHKELEHPT
jgi:hypothetical protein